MKGNVESIRRIFDTRETQLVIPVYQRNYDWGKPQCQQLLDDLVDLVKSKRPRHFFGSIVGKPEGMFSWVVIDGQQRLTTVSLLFLALARLLEDGTITGSEEASPERIRGSFLVTTEEGKSPRFRLKPIQDDAQAYMRLFDENAELIQGSSVTANYRFFMENLPRLELTADEFMDAIYRLEVMHLDLEEHDDPQRIFESLNSTGLALSEADKVRNLVLMGLPSGEQQDLYENYWNQIEKNVSFETAAFLRWYLTIERGRIPRKDRIYEEFKTFMKSSGHRGESLLRPIRRYSDDLRQVTIPDTDSKRANRVLRRIAMLESDVTLPFLIQLTDEYVQSRISEDDYVASLSAVETYIFRRVVCSLPTNAHNKLFASLHREVMRLRKPENSYSEVLIYSLLRREGSAVFPSDEDFRQAWLTRDFYRMKPRLRAYVFDSLENGASADTRDIASRLESKELTVEHIMPQTLTETWRQEIGPAAEEIHEAWLHRIANLTVTGYNSKYSNQPFEKKKTIENGFNASPYRLNQLVKESDHWTEKQLQKRSEELWNYAAKLWPMPKSNFNAPERQLPVETLASDIDFTGMNVVGYEYDDITGVVSNWRMFTVEILQYLLERYREAMLRFAQSGDQYLRLETTRPLSKRFYEHIGSGIYFRANSSTEGKLALLRKLFDYLDLNQSELIIKLKITGKSEKDDPNIDEAESVPPSKYEDLKKYIPLLQEFEGTNLSLADTADLRTSFRKDFSAFALEDPRAVLGTLPLAFENSEDSMAKATDEQLIALIQARLRMEEEMDPEAINQVIANGKLIHWLEALS